MCSYWRYFSHLESVTPRRDAFISLFVELKIIIGISNIFQIDLLFKVQLGDYNNC